MIYLLLLVSYVLGSIPFALVVGKGFYKTDLRQHGSGNLGGTNTFRVLGKKAGIIVTLADLLKGTLAASLPLLIGVELNPVLAGLPAIIGHCFPIFANFKGGKAVATTAGVLLLSSPLAFLIAIVTFLISLKTSKYVSLSSIIASISFVLFSVLAKNVVLILFSIFIAAFIIYRHRENLKRIKNKTEPKVKWI